MRGRKFLAVGICGMVAVGLVQGVSAANTSENPVPVTYDYSGTAEPVDPNYGVTIPTGLVFNSSSPDTPLDITVEMVAAPGQESIVGECQATVSIASANGYKVKIAKTAENTVEDAIPYVVKYGTAAIDTNPSAKSVIGTLKVNVQNTTAVPKIEGTAKLNGVATKTGAHIDTLTYTIANGPAS